MDSAVAATVVTCTFLEACSSMQVRNHEKLGTMVIQMGPVNVHHDRLPVYKDQTNTGGNLQYNPEVEQDMPPGSHGQSIDGSSAHGGGVLYKAMMHTAGAVAIAPPRHTSMYSSNVTSPTTEIQEHLLVATVVPDSLEKTVSSGHNVVTAVPLTGCYWKVLAAMIVIVLVVGAIIGGVCATGGCSSSSQTIEPPFGSPSPPTMSPTLSTRAEQVTNFINNITLTGRTIADLSLARITASLDPEELALHWLILFDTD
jgi:hypothetical protein